MTTWCSCLISRGTKRKTGEGAEGFTGAVEAIFFPSKAIAILGISRARRQACRRLAAVGFVTELMSKFPEANFSPLATKELAARNITILHAIKYFNDFILQHFGFTFILFHFTSGYARGTCLSRLLIRNRLNIIAIQYKNLFFYLYGIS